MTWGVGSCFLLTSSLLFHLHHLPRCTRCHHQPYRQGSCLLVPGTFRTPARVPILPGAWQGLSWCTILSWFLSLDFEDPLQQVAVSEQLCCSHCSVHTFSSRAVGIQKGNQTGIRQPGSLSCDLGQVT